MNVHAPTGGISTLPTTYNDTKAKPLLTAHQAKNAVREPSTPSTLLVSEGMEPGEMLRCCCCGEPFDTREGHVHPRGGFYCEQDVWLLAENGEFYCGD